MNSSKCNIYCAAQFT